jgi:hypothetical protein
MIVQSFAFLMALAALVMPASTVAAPTVFKCTADGQVSYQSVPCASGAGARTTPTAAQLNAERRKKLQQAASAPAAPAAEAAAAPRSPGPGAGSARPTATAFKCDGRTHCSQMRSCAEAKYFLANCPGVAMDGNRDGVPCERQWCGK